MHIYFPRYQELGLLIPRVPCLLEHDSYSIYSEDRKASSIIKRSM